MTLARELVTTGPAVALPLAAGSPAKLAQKNKEDKTDRIASYELTKGENLDTQIKASLTGKRADAKSEKVLVAASLIGCREESNA